MKPTKRGHASLTSMTAPSAAVTNTPSWRPWSTAVRSCASAAARSNGFGTVVDVGDGADPLAHDAVLDDRHSARDDVAVAAASLRATAGRRTRPRAVARGPRASWRRTPRGRRDGPPCSQPCPRYVRPDLTRVVLPAVLTIDEPTFGIDRPDDGGRGDDERPIALLGALPQFAPAGSRSSARGARGPPASPTIITLADREEQQPEAECRAFVLVAEDRDDRGGRVAPMATSAVIRRPKMIAEPSGARRKAVTGYSRGAVTIAPMAANARMTATAIAAGRLALPDSMKSTVPVRARRETMIRRRHCRTTGLG